MRVPLVIRWPGHIKPGTVLDDIFASYDWLPTFVEIAGGAKGNDLNKQIMAGKYPGIVKTKLQGVNQLDYLTGKSEKSARDTFLYYTGATPSAVPRSRTSGAIPSSRLWAETRSPCCP